MITENRFIITEIIGYYANQAKIQYYIMVSVTLIIL